MKKDVQQELFKAETTWFHVFKAMIDSGELAEMSGSSVKIYLVVKAYTNFSTGRSFPALETIAEKSGLSIAQVKRELISLEERGYIKKNKVGRNNVYTLREKVEIQDENGRPAAVASWDYLPSSVQAAVADLKKVLVTGDLAGAKVVHIDRLQVNFINAQDNAVVINIQDLESLPKEMKEALLSIKERIKRKDDDGTLDS
jgi:DNA-binding transcriptional ArsR family regulator